MASPQKDVLLSKTISYNLKKLREKYFPEFGRMKEMCNLVGVTPQTWNKWEAGVSVPSDRNQRKIAEVFRISLGELRDEEPPEKQGNEAAKQAFQVFVSDGGETITRYLVALGRLSGFVAACYSGVIPLERVAQAAEVLEAVGDGFQAELDKAGTLPGSGRSKRDKQVN